MTTPHAPDGKPNLSGVWKYEITTVAEVKRPFGNRLDDAIKVNSIGMEIGTQHKYNFDILVDFRPEIAAATRSAGDNVPMRGGTQPRGRLHGSQGHS